MDIKDWILVGGGLLLIAVIGHGFWLAWRSRRDTLKIDIDPNIPRGDFEDLDLLRRSCRTAAPACARSNRSNRPTSHWSRSSNRRRSARTSAQADRRASQNDTASRTDGAKRSESLSDRAGRPRDRGREAARAVPQPIQTRPAEKAADVDAPSEPVANRSIPPEVIVINVLARNGSQVRRHRTGGGVPAQRTQVRRHEHLPSHPAGIERSAVQRRERGGTGYVRSVRDGSDSRRRA